MSFQIKTNCPTLKRVIKTNGIPTKELDAKEGIDKRLYDIRVRKAEYERKRLVEQSKQLIKRNNKLKYKRTGFSLVIRLVTEKDIYFGKDDNGNLKYFFSYVKVINGKVEPFTEWFANYDLALHRMVQVQQQQTIGE